MEDVILRYEGVAYVVCPSCKEPIRTTMVTHAVGHERQAVVDAMREAERVGLISEELKLHLLNLIYKYTAGEDAYEGMQAPRPHRAARSGQGGFTSRIPSSRKNGIADGS